MAHSSGGVVASELVRLAPGRVTGLVAVAAVIPAAGASSLPFPHRMILPVILRIAGTRPPEATIRNSLAAGLDEKTVQLLLADLAPERRSYFTGRTVSDAALASVPKAQYILTTDDAEIPGKLQRRYAARLRGPRIVEISGGHLPMLARAAVLRSVITDFIAPQTSQAAS